MAIIYKITNQIDNKSYIGETIRDLKTRWREHIHESFTPGHGYNYHLHCAIRKYGTDNFKIEEIDSCIDEQRFQIESFYIQKYDTANPDKGYNTVIEGSGHTLISTDAILEAWSEGLTISETARILGIHKATVSKRLHANGITQEEINKRFINSIKQRCSYPVEQYTLEGIFIKEWPSASECGRSGFSQTMISSVCRQEQITAHNFLWKYKDDERDIQEWVKRVHDKKDAGRPKKPIQQFDLNMNLIAEFPSASAAAQALGLKDKSGICAAARKGRKAYNSYWKYKLDK